MTGKPEVDPGTTPQKALPDLNVRVAYNPGTIPPKHLKTWALIEDLQHLSVVALPVSDRFAHRAGFTSFRWHTALQLFKPVEHDVES